jgi:hypothetical protein
MRIKYAKPRSMRTSCDGLLISPKGNDKHGYGVGLLGIETAGAALGVVIWFVCKA